MTHNKGADNAVADCLSRACATSIADLPVLAASWPAHAKSQAELDNIACEICHDADAADNMVICDGCERCMHLRCLVPPQTTAPSGQFFCPACDVGFQNSVAELADGSTPLRYNSGQDPHNNEALLLYLHSGRQDALLPDGCRDRQAVLDQAIKVRLHQKYDNWLVLHKKIRHGSYRWLCCPLLQFRWDTIRLVHEALGHAGVEQTLTVMHQHFHWAGIRSDIALYIKACDACQRSKLVHLHLPDLQAPAVYGPLWHGHVDLAGPFKTKQHAPILHHPMGNSSHQGMWLSIATSGLKSLRVLCSTLELLLRLAMVQKVQRTHTADQRLNIGLFCSSSDKAEDRSCAHSAPRCLFLSSGQVMSRTMEHTDLCLGPLCR